MGKFSKELQGAKKIWKKAKPAAAAGEFVNENVPDGRYAAKLVLAEVTKLANKLHVVVGYEVTDEEAAGEVVKNRYDLTREESVGYLKRDLAKFEVDIDDDDIDLEEALEALLEREPEVRVMVKMKDEFQNVFLNKVESMEEPTEADDEGEDEPDEPAAKPKAGKKPAAKPEPEPEPEDDAAEEIPTADDAGIEKGSKVNHDEHGECEVVFISSDGTSLHLKDEEGNRHKAVGVADVTLIEDEPEKPAPKAGKKPAAAASGKGGGKKPVKPEPAEEEGGDLEVGQEVVVQYKDEDHEATIVALNEKDETVKVKLTKLKKTVTVPVGDVEIP